MSPQNGSVATVKELMVDVMRERNALVGRLNAMQNLIEEEEDPLTKVRRKVAWMADRDHSVEALSKIVASLQRALGEEERNTHGSAASRCNSAGSAASIVRAASLVDAPRAWKEYRSSSAPPLALATWPHRRLPSRPGGPLVEEDSPPSSLSKMLKRISSEASMLPQQVRRSLKNSAWRFSESVLRRVGWNPAQQDSGLGAGW
jgi:hypothetical protein